MIDRPATAAPTVLVVDDEPYILDLLTSALRMNGFEVVGAVDGRSALAAAAQGPDVVVLDVMLPDMDGFAVARRLRDSGNNVPVLFLTARDAVQDRIDGLNAGGDDYVSKPFSLEEVILRLRGILRRTRGPAADAESAEVLRYGDLALDVGAHTVHRAGAPIVLSATEFSLLRYLVLNAGKVVSKAQILDRVWSAAAGTRRDRAVESFISQLRRKVDDGRSPLIHTVRGVGYTLRLPDEPR